MSTIVPSPFLKRVLMVDAVSCAAAGLLLLALGEMFAPALGIPASFSQPVGLSLVGFAAVVGLVAVQSRVSPAIIWAIIAYNALWAIESVMVLALGWLTPTTLGIAFVLAQAIWVAILAEAQFIGLRKTGRVQAA